MKRIQDVTEMREAAAAMEQQSIDDCNRWAMECGAAADAISKQLFESVIADEERHYDGYDSELDKLWRFGEKYLVLQSIEGSRAKSAGETTD